MPDENVHYSVTDHVAEITLDRPPVNAFSLPFLDQILAALRRAAADREARVVILRSALPKIFCAGLDLDIILGSPEPVIRQFLNRLYIELWDTQVNLGKPVIAALDGAARGGGMTLAISCDMIIASKSASFGYPEIDLGLLPAIHFAHLHRITGRYRSFDLLFTGRSFHTDEALSLGLISRCVPAGEAVNEARSIAQVLAAKSPAALLAGRAAFHREADRDYAAAVARAVDDFCATATSPSAQEGLKAFLERRKPMWPSRD